MKESQFLTLAVVVLMALMGTTFYFYKTDHDDKVKLCKPKCAPSYYTGYDYRAEECICDLTKAYK